MKSKIFTLFLFLFCVSGCNRNDVLIPVDPIGETIKVGILQPISILQPNGHFDSFARGARFAAAEINASGGILGAKVELIGRDTESIIDDLLLPPTYERPPIVNIPYIDQVVNLSFSSDTDTHPIQAANALFEKAGVVALLDPIYPIGHDINTVELAPALRLSPRLQKTASALSYSADDLVFPVADSSTRQGELLADFAVTVFNAKRATMVYQVGDHYSMVLQSSFFSEFAKHGGANVADGTYYMRDTHFTDTLSRIRRGAPDVIIVSGFPEPEETARFIQAARDFGIETPILGDNAMGTAKLFDILKDKENTYYLTHFIDSWKFPSAYTLAYTSMFGSRPDGTAAAGYDALYLLKVAIETAGSTAAVDIREAIVNLMNFRAATQTYHYNQFRHPVKDAYIVDVALQYPEYAKLEHATDFSTNWHIAIIDEEDWEPEQVP